MNTNYKVKPVNHLKSVNQNPKRSDEPIWWGLFGAGGTWFAMITPITILVLGILVPGHYRCRCNELRACL